LSVILSLYYDKASTVIGGLNLKSKLIIVTATIVFVSVVATGCIRVTDISIEAETQTTQTSTPEQNQELRSLQAPTLEQNQESQQPSTPQHNQVTQPHQPSTPQYNQETNTLENQEENQTETVLTVGEAQDYLNWYFESVSYLPTRDRQEEGIKHYCFLVEYPGVCARVFDAFAWVNSVTWELSFEEPRLYSNIPDNRVPVPMVDGIELPYESFVPPFTSYVLTSYSFLDTSVRGSYQVQLREAGFKSKGEVAGFDPLWVYEHDDGATLLVGIKQYDETLFIDMLIRYNLQLDYDNFCCPCIL